MVQESPLLMVVISVPRAAPAWSIKATTTGSAATAVNSRDTVDVEVTWVVPVGKDSVAMAMGDLKPLSAVMATEEEAMRNSSKATAAVIKASLDTLRDKAISVRHMEEAVVDMVVVTAGSRHLVRSKP